MNPKLGHILLFAALTYFGLLTPISWWAILVVVVLAGITEFAQKVMKQGRTGSWRDVGIDCLGIAPAVAVFGLTQSLIGLYLLCAAILGGMCYLFLTRNPWGMN